MKDSHEVAVRKRSQISNANRAMFLWIAGASALVGAALVVGVFLFQQLMYNEKVLAEKQKTASTLVHNNQEIDGLKEEVRVLDTNTNLEKLKANPNDQALQVILDALPSDANILALGSSLQNKLLTGIPGLQPLESLTVNPVATSGPEDTMTTVSSTASATTPQNSIGFSFSVVGTQDALKQALTNLERSIRTIEIVTLHIDAQEGGKFLMTVTARAYYEPARTLEVTEKVVPR